MNRSIKRFFALSAIFLFTVFGIVMFSGIGRPAGVTFAQDGGSPTPSPTPIFDQAAAIAKLNEQIKGRESEPAGEVFKNVKDFKDFPAGRLLAVMEFGYARSLGVDCTHCHTPENFASDEKPAKGIAREMSAMKDKINNELLPSIKAFEGRFASADLRSRPVVNCTTCHRGQVKPATNLGR